MAELKKPNWLMRCWSYLWNPSARWPLVVLIVVGAVIGVAASGMFAVTMHMTGTDEFCSGCHQVDIVPEWKQSVHYVNPAGLRAGCGDCHDPSDPIRLVLRKFQGLDELWNQILGTLATPEKFEANRLRMAQLEWTRMRADHSQNCQNCHSLQQMTDPANASLSTMHRTAIANGQACIDCHKGVAHTAPSTTALSRDGPTSLSFNVDHSAAATAEMPTIATIDHQ
jgi:cytochrome c-type protein NapC